MPAKKTPKVTVGKNTPSNAGTPSFAADMGIWGKVGVVDERNSRSERKGKHEKKNAKNSDRVYASEIRWCNCSSIYIYI